MSEHDLRDALYGSFKNRAMMYYYIFDEMRKEIGEEKAAEIMKRAIYKRGLEIGKQFARYAPSDMNGIKEAFLAFIPDEGKMFEPELLRCDSEGVDIKFHRCPLRYRKARERECLLPPFWTALYHPTSWYIL
ncbi:MAG: L-2-amino-thiazoline-4-carboxylic acid hydrolase [Deltaproteobacteria bacterium]|nr:L-2-amino-thiazoline-4-carboxylic acid hydrolase [Deltaproteobacteria bacterium]MBW2150226.1 L-2-amino-thiazoline-4-carboxylic acid hydrolase [Deltaproteobacteria bacterium]